MSEPQKHSGDPSLFSATVKGDNAGDFLEGLPGAADSEVVEEATQEPVAEEVQAEDPEVVSEESAVEEESEAARLVRETTERMIGKAREQVAPQPASEATARMEGRIQELKDQITQMGRAQEVPEPDEGFDVSLLDSPEVRAVLEQAGEDPVAQAKAQAFIAQKVYESHQGKDIAALKEELASVKQAGVQEQRRAANQQMFVEGLKAAHGVGEVEGKLVEQFVQAQELEHWNAHLSQTGSLEGYQPKSLLGVWLMNKPQFAATPELMQAGTMLLAKQLGAQSNTESASVSTTGAGAPAKRSGASRELENPKEELTPEDEILKGIMDAAKPKKNAFKVRDLL